VYVRVLVEVARQENHHFHCSPVCHSNSPFSCLKAPIITKAGLRRGRDSDIDSTLSHETFLASIHHGLLTGSHPLMARPQPSSTTGSCKVFSDYSKWRTAKRIHVAVHTTDSRKSAPYHYWQAGTDISILYSAVDIRMDKLGTAWTIILLSFRYTWLIGEIIPSQMFFDGSTSYCMYECTLPDGRTPWQHSQTSPVISPRLHLRCFRFLLNMLMLIVDCTSPR
jgi:hypothetical protein